MRSLPLLSLIFAVPALAGESASPPVEEEIIVTSPYQRQRFDVLQATSVLSGEKLDQQMEITIGETLARLPGVESSSFGPGASRPILRGLAGERVRVLTDGIGSIDASNTSPDHAVTGEPITAERIEVLRGPASLLYGSSAAGGVVNIVDGRIPSRLPDGAAKIKSFARYGTVDDERSIAGSVDLALGSKGVFHADGFFRETDDMKIPGFAFSQSLREELAGSGEEFERDIIDNTDLKNKGVAFGATAILERGFIGASISLLDSNYGVPVEEEEEGEEEGEGEEAHGAIRIALDQTLFSVKGEYGFDGFVENAKLRFGYGDYKHQELEGDEVGTTFLNKGWEGRLELVERPWGDFQGAFGVQLRARDFEAIGEEAFVPPNTTFQAGLFALQEYHPRHWHFEASARYELTDVDADQLGLSRRYDSVSASLGVAHTWDDWLRAGASLFRTERAPAAEELFSDGPHLATGSFERGNADLREEVAIGAEVSLKAEGARVALGLNLFYTDYDDFIIERRTGEIEDGLPVFQFTQTAAEFYGAELELAATLVDHVDWQLNFDLGADILRAQDRDLNQPLPRMPAKSVVMGLSATSDSLDGRVEIEMADAQKRLGEFETPTQGYTVLNADLGWHPFGEARDITLMLQGRNLTNAEIRRHVSFLKDRLPLAGRSIRLALRADF